MEDLQRFKMYKNGKKWAISATVVAGVVAIQAGTNASANELQSTTSAQEVSSQVSTTVTATTPDEGKQIIDDRQSQVDTSVSNAEDNGVIVNQNEETELHLNDDNYKEITDQVQDDLAKQQATIDAANSLNQANQDAYDQATADRDATLSQGEQDLNDAKDDQQTQVDDSKEAGVDTTNVDEIVTPDYQDLTGLTGQALLDAMQQNIALYEDVVNQAIANTNTDTEKLKDLTDAYQSKVIQYQAEKTRIEKENADKQAAYDKALNEYLNGLNVNANMAARTDTDMGSGQYETMMTAEVNAQTGEFTLKHDMNDGVSVIGNGELTGRVIFNIVSNGDGTETITVTGIELYKYSYVNLNHNTARNKNINFHVYDSNGNELFTVAHDGETSFERYINQTFALNNVITLVPGQQSDDLAFLRIDDNWVYNTHGNVFINFHNINEQVALPDYEQLPTEPEKVQGQVTSYSVTALPEAETPTPQVVTVSPYKVTVDPKVETSSESVEQKLTVVEQGILPETGIQTGSMFSVAGFALLSTMGALGATKGRKRD